MTALSPNELSRLRWRCRRGMKELDIVLERYLKARYDDAPAAEQAEFLALLDCEDPDLWAWVIGAAELPNEFRSVLQRIRGDA